MAKAQLENGFLRVANELMDALVRSDLSGREFRVFLAIMRETYGWNTKERSMTLRRISDMTGVDRRHVPGLVRGLINRNMIRRNGVTGIETDCATWTRVTPNSGAPFTVSEVTPCTVSEVTPPTVSPLLVKDMKDKKDKKTGTGDTVHGVTTARKNDIQKRPKNLNAQQEFVEAWRAVYEAKTGSPFVASREDFIMSAKLIGEYGLDACRTKAEALALMCEEGARFPAKNGWADFTIRNMVRNWNSIILQVRRSDREVNEQELMGKIEAERSRRARINGLLHADRTR